MKYQTMSYTVAFVMASLFAVGIAGTGWILNHSMFPPMGGGWKLTVATPIISWLVIFFIVLMERKAREPRKFRLDRHESKRN
jgi:hypothetical protein